jgi:hypothetical protein
MKKILKPSRKEEAAYYSDFQGKAFDLGIPPIVIQICCNYGSSLDGEYSELHLTEEEGKELLRYLKDKLTPESRAANKHIFDKV